MYWAAPGRTSTECVHHAVCVSDEVQRKAGLKGKERKEINLSLTPSSHLHLPSNISTSPPPLSSLSPPRPPLLSSLPPPYSSLSSPPLQAVLHVWTDTNADKTVSYVLASPVAVSTARLS